MSSGAVLFDLCVCVHHELAQDGTHISADYNYCYYYFCFDNDFEKV